MNSNNKKKFIFRQLLLDRTEPYRSPAVQELAMDVDDGGTGVVVMWCCGWCDGNAVHFCGLCWVL